MQDNRPRLEGKVAIVTGAGTRDEGVGNGKAAAILFAREGAKVVLADIELDKAESTRKEIESEGGTALAVQADVTNEADCRGLIEAAFDIYGAINVLHNNVGNSIRQPVTEIDPNVWDQFMALNLKSMMLTSKFAIPHMVNAGGGSIINVASIAGLRASKAAAYTTSKAGVIGLTMSMAADHGPEGVRVNAIAPGAVYTPMVAWRLSEKMREQRKNSTMLRAEGTPWDVAWAAVYLASDESKWVTGSVLTVDGGASMMSRHAYFDE